MVTYSESKGFSLVEILAALVILAVGMLAIAKIQVLVLQRENYSKQYAEGIVLAKSKIEELRNFDSIATGTGTLAYEDIASGTDTVTVGVVSYTRKWTVVEDANIKYKTVNVVVGWIGNDGKAKEVSLDTIIAEIDPTALGGVTSPDTGNTTP